MVHWVADPPGCSHLDMVQPVTPSANGCEDCLRIDGRWVHLRMCLTCGHAGCCDQSPNQHASKHARASGHPLMRSMEPDEDWGWCFVDEVWLDPATEAEVDAGGEPEVAH